MKRKSWGALPLTLRLVAGYTLAAAIILIAAALYLYQGLKQGFVLEDTELLSDQVEQVRELVSHRDEAHAEVRQFVLAAAGVRGLEKYYGRLLDERGVVVVETPGMERVAPRQHEFPTPVPVDRELRAVAFYRAPQVPLSLLGAAQVAPPPGVNGVWTFQIALDAAHVDEWLGEYRERLYWMIGGGTVLIGLLGWFITRQGLRPLRQITSAIKEVTANEMDRQLDVERWPAELAALASEFDDMLRRLRDAFDRLARFSADVAHEFRTPLNNLMGATSLTLSQPRTLEDYRSALENNLEQYERLRSMVQSLLFIARAENAEAVLNRRPTDMGAIASEVCDFFSAMAEEREITLKAEGSATISVDDVLLRMALSNLISNGLRHTRAGGAVNVAVKSAEGGAQIIVSDTGAGICEEHLPHVFDRFYRVDESRASSEGGTGLGLAIVRSVAALHGGTARVESQVGEGTTFHLFFPDPQTER